MMKPPNMPTKSAMMVSSGSMTAVAISRGVTSFWTGSVPSARMASICSVTFMEPEFAGDAGSVAPRHHAAP